MHAKTRRRGLVSALVLLLVFVQRTHAQHPLDDGRLPEAPGEHVTGTDEHSGFSTGQPLVLTTYFYWYDAGTKEHILDADGTDALTDHPPTLEGLSYRNPVWHRQQLEDMRAAGIDVALPVYWGTPGTPDSWSNQGLPPLARACDQLAKRGREGPKIGMFYDTSTLQYNPQHMHVDLRTAAGRKWFYGTIRDFFSLIPPRHRAVVEGRPLVFLYASAFAAGVDERLFPEVRNHFRRDFGTDLYLVKMDGWPGEADSVYRWGGAITPQYLEVAGIGPGYDHSAVPGRQPLVRDRQGGLFYRRAWERLLAEDPRRRPWMVHLETWNEFHEGTDICESREYGRQYIEMTRQYADLFHARQEIVPQHVPKVPRRIVGSPGKEQAIRCAPPPGGDGPAREIDVAGRRAWTTMPNEHSPHRRYLYFDVADEFLGLGDKSVRVTISYLDQGPKQFVFEYDSADPHRSGVDQRFRPGHVQPLPGGGAWREVSFVIPHARFVGRANGADFRLACVDEELVVHSFELERLADR